MYNTHVYICGRYCIAVIHMCIMQDIHVQSCIVYGTVCMYVCMYALILQDIECLCVSESYLVSASLDGDIRVWNTDAMTRGCARIISRRYITCF